MEKFIKPSSKFDNFKYTVNALISLSSLNLFSGKCDEIQSNGIISPLSQF